MVMVLPGGRRVAYKLQGWNLEHVISFGWDTSMI